MEQNSSKQSFSTSTNARNIRSNSEENVHSKNSSNKCGEGFFRYRSVTPKQYPLWRLTYDIHHIYDMYFHIYDILWLIRQDGMSWIRRYNMPYIIGHFSIIFFDQLFFSNIYCPSESLARSIWFYLSLFCNVRDVVMFTVKHSTQLRCEESEDRS